MTISFHGNKITGRKSFHSKRKVGHLPKQTREESPPSKQLRLSQASLPQTLPAEPLLTASASASSMRRPFLSIINKRTTLQPRNFSLLLTSV